MFLPTGLVELQEGVVAWQEALHQRYNLISATEFNVADEEYGAVLDGVADDSLALRDAYAAALAVTGGKVVIPAGILRLTDALGDLEWDPGLVSLEGAGAGTVIKYEGNGIGLTVATSPISIQQPGTIGGFTIDGSAAGADAVGLRLGDAVGLGISAPIIVKDFDGAGQCCVEFHNTSGWTERTWAAAPIRTQNGKVHYRFSTDGVAPANSMAYNHFKLQFDKEDGQIVFQTLAGVFLGDVTLDLHGNTSGGGYIFDIQTDSFLIRPHCNVTVEQTLGTGTEAFTPTSARMLAPTGKVAFINFGLESTYTVPDYLGSGEEAVMIEHLRDALPLPLQSFGITAGNGIAGWYVVTFAGGVGNGFTVFQKGATDDIADAVEIAHLGPEGLVLLGDRTTGKLTWAAGGLVSPGKLMAADGLGTGGTALATTPGTVVKRMPIYDEVGALLGYVPIYDDIT